MDKFSTVVGYILYCIVGKHILKRKGKNRTLRYIIMCLTILAPIFQEYVELEVQNALREVMSKIRQLHGRNYKRNIWYIVLAEVLNRYT